jgi:hypothetical protein
LANIGAVSDEPDSDKAWYAQWRFWVAGAVAFTVIWIVEVLRKGGLIWPWPAVPLVIWALVIRVHPRPEPER